MTQLIPGWYPDPTNPLQERLWDGSEWVDKVRPRAPQVDAMPADDPVVVGDASPRIEKGIEVRYKRPWRVTWGQQSQVDAALKSKGIPYKWEDKELVVDKSAEFDTDVLWEIHTRKRSGLALASLLLSTTPAVWTFLQPLLQRGYISCFRDPSDNWPTCGRRETRLFGIIADRAGVMFLVPFFSALVAVVLGHIVLLQTTDKAHLRGRSKALFGVVVGWMTVAVYIFSSLYYGW